MCIDEDLPYDFDIVNPDVDDGNIRGVADPVHVNGDQQRRNLINLYFR